jgi:chloride channel protein, CIC family
MQEKLKIKALLALQRFMEWRSENLSDKQYLYLLSVVVGFISGIAAVILKNTVHLVELVLTNGISGVHDYLYFVYPVCGIVITVLIVQLYFKTPVGHGVPDALLAISKGNANLPKSATWSSIITSAITVGLGGSVGLEGPAVATTSAIGSNLGQLLKLNYKTKVILIACASSATVASLFKAPIAAIVFSLEVIMIDLSAVSLVPLLLSAISANIVTRLFIGSSVLFHYNLPYDFEPIDTVFFVALGILCGLVSVYYTKIYFLLAKWMEGIKKLYLRVLIGAASVGLLIYFLPPLYGEGYGFINALIAGKEGSIFKEITLYNAGESFWTVVFTFLAFIFLKAIASTLTIKSGGVGGIFAPSLFIGAATGAFFSHFVGALRLSEVHPSHFILVAMGGLMAGVLHAPLTGIFLIAEITGGYALFMPLMIASSLAFITVKYASPYSIYTRQLATRGELLTHHKDQAVLTLMSLQNEIETEFVRVHPYDSLRTLVKAVANSSRNLFPVVKEDQSFVGVVMLDDIRSYMFDQTLYDTLKVHEVMTAAPEFIYVNDTMTSVMTKFDQSGAWNLPVLSADGKFMGFVSKAKLFTAYRKRLKDFYEEG